MGENFTAFLLGQAVRRSMGAAKTPVAYLYNGVRLPKLPETDLPYAYIGGFTDNVEGTFLILRKTQLKVSENGTVMNANVNSNRYKLTDGEWVSTSEYWMGFAPTWANTDIYYDEENGGGLFLAASDPIPVYE